MPTLRVHRRSTACAAAIRSQVADLRRARRWPVIYPLLRPPPAQRGRRASDAQRHRLPRGLDRDLPMPDPLRQRTLLLHFLKPIASGSDARQLAPRPAASASATSRSNGPSAGARRAGGAAHRPRPNRRDRSPRCRMPTACWSSASRSPATTRPTRCDWCARPLDDRAARRLRSAARRDRFLVQGRVPSRTSTASRCTCVPPEPARAGHRLSRQGLRQLPPAAARPHGAAGAGLAADAARPTPASRWSSCWPTSAIT